MVKCVSASDDRLTFSVIQNSCLYKSTNALPKLCISLHLKMTGTSTTDDATVKVPLFQKVNFFLQYDIFHRVVIHLYFLLYENVSDCHNLTLQMISFNQTPLFYYVKA